MKKKFPDRDSNPSTKPIPHNPSLAPSMDSRDNHGLSKDEALKGKK